MTLSLSKTLKHSLMLTSTVLLLASCQTTELVEFDSKEKSIDHALQQAALQASVQGATDQSVLLYEKLYKRNPDDIQIAEQYVSALKEAGYLEQAAFVLKNIATKEDANQFQKLEYGKILLKIGRFDTAETFLRDVVNKDNNNYQALHLLGVALDAQGHHEQAEKALRRSLENWEGDPLPVLNNLALNLAAQGYFDEANVILAQAKSLNPDNETLQNNFDVIQKIK